VIKFLVIFRIISDSFAPLFIRFGMSRYRGPRLKIIRRLGQALPGLVQKQSSRANQPPGEHGFGQRRQKLSQYAIRLQEKQKLRFQYGLTESQLMRYVKEARRRKGSTGDLLLELLEKRLDATLYTQGYAPTLRATRQLVNHGHVSVNGKRVTIPSYSCRPNDVLGCTEKKNTYTAAPFSVNELLIIEYYSRK
jgi:small subunit ribosomal protein S4